MNIQVPIAVLVVALVFVLTADCLFDTSSLSLRFGYLASLYLKLQPLLGDEVFSFLVFRNSLEMKMNKGETFEHIKL